jgi:uncharacterized protein (DUF885 family)
MMITRRNLMSSTAVAVAAAAFPPPAKAATPAELNQLFDALFLERLRDAPERATILGLDKGPNVDLKAKLSDGSAEGFARTKALTADQLRRLKAFDASGLTGLDRVNYDTIQYAMESTVRVQAFAFGAPAGFGPSPYVISQLSGVYQEVPDFLDTKHGIAAPPDCDAYLARLESFAIELNNDTEKLRQDSAMAVVPPDFILDLTLTQLGKTRVPADQSVLVTSIARRAMEKNLSASYAQNATRIYTGKIGPALDRQIAAVTALRARANHDSSLSSIKDGKAYYAASLHYYTTTKLTPQEIHRLGLEQSKEIGARLDKEMRAQGFIKGTIGERLTQMNHDARYLFPNTDAGKVEIIAYCNERLAAVRPKLPAAFKRLPTYAFEVRRVPLATEAGAPGAFSQGPALDGSRPGLVYFNLANSADWAKFDLATTVFHEGLPGHQLAGGLALSNTGLPLIRKTSNFSGYAEGWGLYAEQLADELGMYDQDALGRIGYLKWQLFRASRLVVDTGLFDLNWSREKAIAYFVTQSGLEPGAAAREVERYCTLPGQACSYKLGHNTLVNGRTRAIKALGAKYDIKDFHEACLDSGAVPLDILDGIIDRYIKTKAA